MLPSERFALLVLPLVGCVDPAPTPRDVTSEPDSALASDIVDASIDVGADADAPIAPDAPASDAPTPPAAPMCPNPESRTLVAVAATGMWFHPGLAKMVPAYIATGAESAQWSGRRVRVESYLVIPAGVSLALEDSTVEIVGRTPREHQIYLEPRASLALDNSTVGGVAVRSAGGDETFIQTALDVREGARLSLNNVCVQYNYGILVAGTLDGAGLTGGRNPDTVIVESNASVTLRRSSFDLSFIAQTEAGTFPLTLPVAVSQTTQYGRAGQRIPGVRWLVDLQDHVVPRYWFWFQNVGAAAPVTRVQIRGATTIIPSLLIAGMSGTVSLRSSWATHGAQQVGDFACDRGGLMSGTILDVGNVTVALDTPSSVGSFGLYLNTGASIVARGPSFFSEVILRGGSSLWVEGTPGTLDTALSAVTLEVLERSTLTARATVLGYRWQPVGVQGDLIVNDDSQVRLDRVRWANLQIAQHRGSQVIITDSSALEPFDRACGTASVQGVGAPLRVLMASDLVAPVRLRSALGSIATSMTRDDGVTAGARFVVERDVRVSRIGRRLAPGVASGIVVLRDAMGVERARATVSSSDLWNSDAIAYATLDTPVAIPAGTSFDLFAETPVGMRYFDVATAARSADVRSVRGAFVMSDRTVSVGAEGFVFAAVNAQFVAE